MLYNARRLANIVLVGAGAGVAGVVVFLLNELLAPGAGPVWLACTVILGGIVIQLRRGRITSCARVPRPQPLQVSCLGLLALGVQCYHLAESPAFVARFPLLAIPWLPGACIIGGIVGLGILSLFTDCRDADLRDRV